MTLPLSGTGHHLIIRIFNQGGVLPLVDGHDDLRTTVLACFTVDAAQSPFLLRWRSCATTGFIFCTKKEPISGFLRSRGNVLSSQGAIPQLLSAC